MPNEAPPMPEVTPSALLELLEQEGKLLLARGEHERGLALLAAGTRLRKEMERAATLAAEHVGLTPVADALARVNAAPAPVSTPVVPREPAPVPGPGSAVCCEAARRVERSDGSLVGYDCPVHERSRDELRNAVSRAEQRELAALAQLDEAVALLRRLVGESTPPTEPPFYLVRVATLHEARDFVFACDRRPSTKPVQPNPGSGMERVQCGMCGEAGHTSPLQGACNGRPLTPPTPERKP